MPRIDPLDLLKCLGVLLAHNGGIKGPGEVVRVARLMLRFSKKLVSKCIYIHVLKATQPELLDQFLSEQGAYFLLLKWLIEALQTRNTPLLAEMLELVQLLPMTDARLKDEQVNGLIRSIFPYNDLAQMVQSIAQEYNDQNCRNLATQLWTRWFASPSKPDEFSLAQEGILPDDMDLSIYAPDTSSAPFGDPLNINMGEDVSMTMGNLSTLDMNSCTPYMENNDYYAINHFEPVAMNNNMSHDNQQVYMDGTANYNNEPLQPPQTHQSLQQHQQVLNSGAVEANNQILPNSTSMEWSANNSVAVPPVVAQAPEQSAADESRPAETAATGVPVVLKIKVKGGTYVVKGANNQNPDEPKDEKPSLPVSDPVPETKEKEKSKESKSKDKKKEKDKKSSSSSSKSKESKISDSKKREKEREKTKSLSSSSSKDSKSSSSSSKDRSKSSRDDKKEKPKVKGSPRSEALSKEAKQAEKNRETLAAIKAMTPVVKLAKIPRKKVEDAPVPATDAPAAPAATDVLDKLAPRPKTVKTFNSKFRSTGLVDEPGKSPPIPINKKIGSASPSADKKSPSIKRSGSIDGTTPPADKKLKAVDDSAISAAVAAVMKKTASDIKPAVKLISPRPRPLLQDSSLFMDALEAGSKASTEPRKRKRSGPAKDGAAPNVPDVLIPAKSQDSPAPCTPPAQPSAGPTAPAVNTTEESSPTPVKPMFNFYQDTLETDGATKEDDKAETKEVKEECPDSPSGADKSNREKMEVDGEENEDESSRDSTKTDMAEDESPPQSESGKPKGVLVIHSQQRRRPKKSVQWRAEEELEMHHYFELDETERVNVNKLLFGEMKQAEREREKQAFQMSKQLTVEEPEVEEVPWKGLIPIDLPEDRVIYGENSQERKVQAARESSTLQALYFKGQLLPDTPIEADPEVPLERTDSIPTVIPLDDVTGNPESVYDHRHLPWPEPKTQMYMGPSHHVQQAPLHHPQQQYGQQMYRTPAAPVPVDPYYPDHGPVMHGDMYGHGGHVDMPHHGGPPMHHHQGGGRPGGPSGPPRGDVGGTWMAGDGSVYPDHDVSRYNDGPPHRDGMHHRDAYHHREREPPHPRDRGGGGHGYNDIMGGPGPGYMGAPRGIGMDGPRPRFHAPSRGGGGRPGGPPVRGGPSNQPCWHFMRGFCRLENRCKFLHPSNYNGAPMP